jgi:hypothetical protein
MNLRCRPAALLPSDVALRKTCKESVTEKLRVKIYHVETSIAKRCLVLFGAEQAKLLMLCKVRNSLRRADKVLRLKNGYATFASGDVHTGDLQLRIVDSIKYELAGNEALWRDPRLDDQRTTRSQVTCHTANGAVKVLDGSRVTDRSEKAADHVKLPVYPEIHEVALMEGDAGAALTRDPQHLATEIESFAAIVLPEELQVPPGSAGDVKKAGCVRQQLLQKFQQFETRSCVVLVPAKRVIDLSGFLMH